MRIKWFKLEIFMAINRGSASNWAEVVFSKHFTAVSQVDRTEPSGSLTLDMNPIDPSSVLFTVSPPQSVISIYYDLNLGWDWCQVL